MSGNIIEDDGSIASLRPMLHFGDRGNPIPEGMLPPEAMPYENSLDIELALDFFVERVRELEAENRELRERVRVLEKAAYKIVLWEAELPECEVCPSRDECFDHRHGENCVCAMDILNSAKEAVQEAECPTLI